MGGSKTDSKLPFCKPIAVHHLPVGWIGQIHSETVSHERKVCTFGAMDAAVLFPRGSTLMMLHAYLSTDTPAIISASMKCKRLLHHIHRVLNVCWQWLFYSQPLDTLGTL